MTQQAWRKWHRWIGFAACPFLLFAAFTGVFAAVSEMTSENEEAREKARESTSPVAIPAAPAAYAEPIAKAMASANSHANGAPIDKVLLDFKTDPPTVTISLGKPGGGEDRKLIFDARNGEFLREERYIDKPFLTRVHSGEAFGDWGLVASFAWGLALITIIVSGLVIYIAMRRPGGKRLKRLFW